MAVDTPPGTIQRYLESPGAARIYPTEATWSYPTSAGAATDLKPEPLQRTDRTSGVWPGASIAEETPEAPANDPKVQEAYLGGDET